MGLLDSLFGKKCPACGAKGARVTPIETRCPNPACQYFDPSLGRQEQPVQQPTRPAETSISGKSGFVPQDGIEIRYRNFQGQEKTFKADRNSIKRRKNHILARVAPTGKYITLSRDRIQNLSDVDTALPPAMRSGAPWPSARERQVLNYHKKHGTTSPLYEQIRAKFPNW
jgi:hypothetical protein